MEYEFKFLSLNENENFNDSRKWFIDFEWKGKNENLGMTAGDMGLS